jgi:DNA sulfur modification protein DndC
VYASKLKAIRRELRGEYLQLHSKPWIIGFSGGKDSTLLLHLVLDCLLSVAPDERRRRAYVVSNDTLVESPVFQGYVGRLLKHLGESLAALQLPVEVVKTAPAIGETFWVNLLGRGYPAPNRNFRWCTDRMKIRPTTRFIREQVAHNGEVILLLGSRRGESAARAQRLARHEAGAGDGSRLTPHTDLPGCFVFCPIKELTTAEVWIALLNSRPPWGGTYQEIAGLYQNANGGECPFVLGQDDAPSCGTSSARFGCWTCTVVEKDNSLARLLDAGFEHLEPLADFRTLLKRVSDDPDRRSKVRRNGHPGLGPLTIETRKRLLDELLGIQLDVGMELISSQEVRLVREHWARDEADAVIRELANFGEACGNAGGH